jgi:hypothetical protein
VALLAEGERIAAFADRLVSAVNAMDARPGDLKDGQAMAVFAVAKSAKTHRAIMSLCRKGFGEDAAVLVRSMFELATDLKYVAADPSGDRARRWIDYGWALRYEFTEIIKAEPTLAHHRQHVAADEPNQQEITAEARRADQEWGFLRFNKAGEFRGLHPWAGKSNWDVAKEVGWEGHYRTVFKITSMRAHSNVLASNDYLALVNGVLRVRTGRSDNLLEEVLFSANGYLLEVARHWCGLMNAAQELQDEWAKINAAVVDAHLGRIGPERRARLGYPTEAPPGEEAARS